MKDTVAIVGSHPRTRGEFDFNRTDCDIWIFNEALSNRTFPRADAVFQMHVPPIWRNPANRNDAHHFEWLQEPKDGTEVYMQDQYPDVPRSVRYPLEEVTERFGVRHFTSSIAYALALACFKGYRRIEVYGVEMETNTEYQYQRDGVTLWLGVAMGLGIKVDAHISMFDQPLYGYEGEVFLPYETFEQRIAELEPGVNDLNTAYTAAHLNLNKNVENFLHGDNSQAIYAAVDLVVQAGEKLGNMDGALQENHRYKDRADKMRGAAGEFVFSRQEFETAAATLQKSAMNAQTALAAMGGQMELIHANIVRSAKDSPKRARLLEVYKAHLQKYLEVNNQGAIFRGALQENAAYMNRLDKGIRAAGGAKSEAVLLEAENV